MIKTVLKISIGRFSSPYTENLSLHEASSRVTYHLDIYIKAKVINDE